MKRPFLKKLLLSLSLCLSLLCYPYADMAISIMSALEVHADKIMMTLSVIACRFLTDNKPLDCLDIYNCLQASKASSVTQPHDSNITISYTPQSLNNKVSLDQTTNTLTASIEQQYVMDVSQTAQETKATPAKTSSDRVRPTTRSTLRPMIYTEVDSTSQLRSLNLDKDKAGTIELTGATQNYASHHAQETHKTKYTKSTDSCSKPHQQILQDAHKNSVALDQAVHHQGGRMSELQRNTLALATIRNNPQLSAQLDEQYNAFVNALELCAYQNNKALVLENLNYLSNPENFNVLKRVPYLAERFEESLGMVHHLCLNEDGSLRAGGIVGHPLEIARAIATFHMPFNGPASVYTHVVNEMVKAQITGARLLEDELTRYYVQPYVFQFIDLFERKETYASITEKFLSHPFNKDMFTLMHACKAEKWDVAKAIADRYQAEFATMRANDLWDNAIQSNVNASQTLFYQLAYENGVFKKYQHHPLYHHLLQRPYPHLRADEAVNKKLEEEHVIKDIILQQVNVTRAPPLVDKIAYHLSSIFYDPVAVNKALSGLSKDHSDSAVRDAYNVFFNEQGIYRRLNYNPKRLEGVTLPECINNTSHVKTRIALNTLLKIKLPDVNSARHFKTALNYIQQACIDESLKDEYTALAQAICDAMIMQESDKTILQLGDFIELGQTEIQRLERPSLMRDAVMLCEKINQPDISEEMREDYRKKLCMVEITRKKLLTLHKDKQSLLSIFYNEKIRPFLEIVGAYELGITYAQFIYNEIATPTIPTVLMKDAGQNGNQGDYTIEELEEPPQPPQNPKDPDPAKELARGIALKKIFDDIKKKLKSMRPSKMLKQYQKKGTFDTAKKDFDSLALKNVKDISDHKGTKYMGEMPNGRSKCSSPFSL